ncbi:MAG: phosphotransferase [Chloroflexota bacterium]
MVLDLPSVGVPAFARGRLRASFDHLHELLAIRRVRGAAAAVLDAVRGDPVLHEAPAWTVQHARGDADSGFIAVVGSEDAAPRAVVRAGRSAAATARIDREMSSIAAVRSLPLPADTLRLLPGIVASGRVGSLAFAIETALPGRTVDVRRLGAPARRRLFDEARAAIGPIHAAAAKTAPTDSRDVDRWVHRRADLVRDLLVAVGITGREPWAVAALRQRLSLSLEGSTCTRTRVHGDFWAGNLLVVDDPSGAPCVTGIVDWDTSEPDELALQDTLHLELYAEKVVARHSLGQVVAARLQATVGRAEPPDGLPEADRLLLYWLRQVEANHARDAGATSRPKWIARNIKPVLAWV